MNLIMERRIINFRLRSMLCRRVGKSQTGSLSAFYRQLKRQRTEKTISSLVMSVMKWSFPYQSVARYAGTDIPEGSSMLS